MSKPTPFSSVRYKKIWADNAPTEIFANKWEKANIQKGWDLIAILGDISLFDI